MVEENIKNILEDYKEETKRHFDVVAEDFISQTKIIAESLSGIQKQLITLREIIVKNTEAIVDLQTQVIAIREMVAKNTENIEIIKTDTQFIKQGLKQKVDRDEFAVLEKRVSMLEAKLNQ